MDIQGLRPDDAIKFLLDIVRATSEERWKLVNADVPEVPELVHMSFILKTKLGKILDETVKKKLCDAGILDGMELTEVVSLKGGMGQKRARPTPTQDELIDRLATKQRGDVLQVPDQDFDFVATAVIEAKELIQKLRDSDNDAIRTGLGSMEIAALEVLVAEHLPGIKGSSAVSKFQAATKVIFGAIKDAETMVKISKDIYSDLIVESTVALAKEFNKPSGNYAEFDWVGFKAAAQDILASKKRIKSQEDNAAAARAAMTMAEAEFNTAAHSEIQRKAQEMADAMFRAHMNAQSGNPNAGTDKDVEM